MKFNEMRWSDPVGFWFSEAARGRWFRSTPEFDQTIRERFGGVWEAARRGELEHWAEVPEGALALVIVLDQFPLHLFRGEAASYSTEAQARAIAERMIRSGWDRQMEDAARAFVYLPFMHSESLADQDRAVECYREAGLADSLRWAEHHREIIRRFGRFPHRNQALGRASTPEEILWLASKEAFRG